MDCHTLQLLQQLFGHATSLFRLMLQSIYNHDRTIFMLVLLPEEKVCEAAYWVCMKLPRGAAWGDRGACGQYQWE